MCMFQFLIGFGLFNRFRWLYLHGDKNSHTIREYKVLKAKGKDRLKYYTKDYKRKSREVDLLEK